jgi:hypothetical protein
MPKRSGGDGRSPDRSIDLDQSGLFAAYFAAGCTRRRAEIEAGQI